MRFEIIFVFKSGFTHKHVGSWTGFDDREKLFDYLMGFKRSNCGFEVKNDTSCVFIDMKEVMCITVSYTM